MTTARSLRVAHFSDLHYGPKNLAEADRCFATAIDEAIARQAQVAVISGELHVLPSGFHRIRHYGLLANSARKSKLALARELLHVTPAADARHDDTAAGLRSERPTFVCWHCGSAMFVVETLARIRPIRAPPCGGQSP